ncbi:MAG: hypothetical protein K2H31_03480, partial [Lachnospiraceae bacterium]|nr:hypothetical protein [Lachnospiraceae bacterium]
MSAQKKKRKKNKNQQRNLALQSVQSVQTVKKNSSVVIAKNFLPQGTIWLAAFLSLSHFYTEIVFKLSVETFHTGSSFVFLALFSLCAGLVVSGIISLLPKKAVQVLTPFYLGILFLTFVVEFLVYRQFKVAYDLNTIFNAATDALGGFGADIRLLIFCFDGISHIALFLLPLILWFVLREKIIGQLSKKDIRQRHTGRAAYSILSLMAHLTGGAACYGTALFLILCCGLNKDIYTNQYNFESAVMQFGLCEGVCLDIRNLASSKTSAPVFESTELELAQGTAYASSEDALISSMEETVSGGK